MKTADMLFLMWVILKLVIDFIGIIYLVWRFGR